MSDTVNAHDGAVTTIADTDLVMVVGPQGGLHPISFENLAKLVRNTIQIGGRNLIPNSAQFTGWTMKSDGIGSTADGVEGILSVRKSSGPWRGGYKSMIFTEGNYYTFSILTNNPNKASVYLDYAGTSITQTATFTQKTKTNRQILGDWYRASISALCTKSGTAVIEYESTNITLAESVRFCAPKLEIGNIATDWSPAPEDLASAWGGVIGYLPITYNSDIKESEKGGAHECDEGALGCAEISADCHLAFGSLNSACECIGRICEVGSNSDRLDDPSQLGSRRNQGSLHSRNNSTLQPFSVGKRQPIVHLYSNRNCGIPMDNKRGRRRTILLPNFQFRVESLEGNLNDARNDLARKEVAYAD